MSFPTLISGVFAGHWTSPERTTGCTAFLFPGGATAGVCVPGSATGTREMGALESGHLAPEIHGLCLSGGSAFGLAAADGVMRTLAEQGIGFDTSNGPVPIVPAAILYDLSTGTVRPDAASGRAAAESASSRPLAEGRVGAGAGAKVGSVTGSAVPGGFGCSTYAVGEWTVGAAVAVNALGSVRDPETGAWVAGGPPTDLRRPGSPREQTTLAVVVTDAPLDKGAATVLARMASAGLARTLYPAYTAFDGDVVFAVSPAKGPCVDPMDLTRLGHAAAIVVARAIVRAVSRAS
ncbi:MAG: P1 family peptidase [Proteobacteria bacterium]|nr:P1 family peptidase [Pseudomonadota bacterium]